MPITKRILKHSRTQAFLAFLLSLYIRFVYITSRRIYDIDERAKRFMDGDENAIFAFWHGRLMMCPTIEPPKRKMHVLISAHRDGILISKVISYFGEATISGSSSKGGVEAVREILIKLKMGDNISITPDGPRGPTQVAQGGVVTIAKLSKKLVLPITFSTSRAKRFRSWDRFMLALPFGRIVFCAGAPIMVERDADDEQARLMIEEAMNTLVQKADGMTHAA